MKGPVRDPATFSFSAATRTVTFAAPIPVQQAYILGILNVTRNIFIYLPVKSGSGGTYNSGTGVLTLAFDTTTHANGDVLQVIFDDTQSGATAALQTTGNTSLSSIDSKIPTSPATSALQTTGNTSLSSIDSKIPASPSTAALQTTGNTSLSSIDSKIPASPSTAALQTTGNTSLSSIDSKIPTSPSTAALQTTGNTSLSSIDSKATTGNTNTAGIRTDLGTDGTSPPSLPGGATGVRGWLRWLGQSAFQLGSGVITAITLRVTLASDGPGVTALDSINSKTPVSPATSALQTTGNTSLSSIDSKIPASPATSALQITGNTSLSSIDSKTATGNTNTAGIRTDLGTDGTSPPTLPGSSTGVRGWLRWLGQSAFQFGAGAITATTLRVALASDGPGVTALDSINSKTAGVRAPTTTSVASSASSVTLLAANVSRRGLDIFNNSTATLWVSYTTPAEIPGTSAFAIDPGGSLTRDAQLIGTGALYGIWASANGTAQVTEWV